MPPELSRAVAQQHDRADGQVGGFVGQLFQAVADVRGGSGGALQFVEARRCA